MLVSNDDWSVWDNWESWDTVETTTKAESIPDIHISKALQPNATFWVTLIILGIILYLIRGLDGKIPTTARRSIIVIFILGGLRLVLCLLALLCGDYLINNFLQNLIDKYPFLKAFFYILSLW